MERKDLLASLFEAGLVRPEAIRAVLQDPRYSRMSIAQALVEGGLIDEITLAAFMADLYRVPFLRIRPGDVRPEALAMLPTEVASNFCVVPLGETPDGRLRLAMADPFDVTAEDVVSMHTSRPIERVVAPRGDIQEAIKGRAAAMSEALDRYGMTRPGAEVELFVMPDEETEEAPREGTLGEHDAPIIQLVNALIVEAIEIKASDIHVEPTENNLRVRYRVDGVLRTMAELPKTIQNAVISRIKLASGMDISERRRPQDGRSRVRLSQRWVDLRVSTLPTYYGEKAVLRILDKNVGLLQLSGLGMLPDHLALYQNLAENPQGMILITGPTGSGKTTTLYATLNVRNRISDNIVTVEDPIEFQLAGVNQLQVNHKAGVTFASALRSILRQDPDIVMVGEIRDLETAEIAFQASQTGHFVLSTVHTNSAPATLTRLRHMGIVPYLVASSLLAVVAQRLVRRICEHCREETAPAQERLEFLRLATDHALPATYYHGKGCQKCGMTGFSGRLGLYEVLPMTGRIKQQILRKSSQRRISRAAASEGIRTLLDDGLEKVSMGWTTLEEVLRVVTVEVESLQGHDLHALGDALEASTEPAADPEPGSAS